MKKWSNKVRFATAMLMVTALLFSGLVGCKSESSHAAMATPVHSPWILNLEGVRTENIDEATFAAGAAPECHGARWTDDSGQVWEGIPLWLLVGRVDNPNIEHGAGAFDDALADKGYEIEVISSGNQVIKLTSSEVKRNDNIFVAYRLNGQPLPDKQWPLELVGSAVSKQNQIGGITAIKLNFPPVAPAATPNEAGGQVPTTNPASTQLPLIQTGPEDLIGLVNGDPAVIDNSSFPITPVELLHVTGSAQEVDITKYHLIIDGLVDNPLTLSYEDLLQYPATTQTVLLICTQVFVDNASWTGVPMVTLLDAAQVKAEASQVTFHSVDGFTMALSLKDAQLDGVFLAYKVDGQTLPKEHGYPLRLVLKGMYGGNWIKWVDHIEVK